MTWAEKIAALALIVSIAAAYFTYTSPKRAERLRLQTSQRERELQILAVLMSERGRWGSPAMITALNAVKVVFRDSQDILDKWFICYSNVGTERGDVRHYYDLLAAIGNHLKLPMRREDLENFFTNPTEQKETAVKTAQIYAAFDALHANTNPSISRN